MLLFFNKNGVYTLDTHFYRFDSVLRTPSSEMGPAPVKNNVNAPAKQSIGYSKPLFCANKPLLKWTVTMATTMVPANARAPNRVKMPSARAMPPSNSE